MAIKEAGIFNTQTALTAGTSDAIKLRPSRPCSIRYNITTATGLSVGAKLQITMSPHSQIDAGTATWTDYDTTKTVDTLVVSAGGEGCQLTGCRLVVTDATWTLAARQDG